MKARSILAALLLLLACVQTSMGQGFRVYKSDGTVAQFSLRTDSIVFYDGIGTDQDFGPFTPLNDLIAGKWYRTKKEWIVFNEDGTTSGWDNAWNQGMHGDFIYRYFPYQGNIVIYERTTNKPLYFMRVLDRDDERIVTTTWARQVEEIEVLTRTEPPQLVESIVFDITEYNLLVGETATISAIIYPEDAANQTLSWESTNENVATVSNDGFLTATGEGNCWIYCRATDGSGVYGMCHAIVSTSKPVERIELNKRGINLVACQTYQLTPTIYPSNATNKNVVWTSSNESVASVDENGLVTANGDGFCIVTCTAADGSGVKAKCEVTSYFPEYVEIGGLKWATKNVGATSVAGEPQTCFGDYFAWSETSPRYSRISFTSASEATITMKPSYPSGYSVAHYVSYNGSSLDAAHDAATQNMGTGWFTPTKDQYTALADACGNQWKTLSGRVTEGGIYSLSETQTYEPGYTGVAGTLFVSTSDITKRVFFPNSGYLSGTDFYSGNRFWTSNNSGTGKPYYFKAGTISNDLSKTYGLPVRGVSY
jgi:hypothetical protein